MSQLQEGLEQEKIDKDPSGEEEEAIPSSEGTDSESREIPHTIFSKNEKYILMLILSMVGFCSTVSSPIYFPALPTLTAYFKTTSSIMNLSVVAYLVFQGIAPTFVCNIADYVGVRPIIVLSVVVYLAACIAISQTNVYWLLAVLRCVQAAGIAPVIAISSGVSGDVCTPKDRGGFVGVVSGMQLVGNGFGGLIGAALIAGFHTWRAIFVFLSIMGGVVLVISGCFMPETSRSIVGNGSIIPKTIVHRSLLLSLPHMKKKLTNDVSTLRERPRFDILAPFRILIQPLVICNLVPAGLHFASWTMVLTSIGSELEGPKYKYGVLHVGFIYLPQGIACLLSSFSAGRTLNWYYKLRRDQYDRKYEQVPESERPQFNLIRTRLDIIIVPAILMIIGLVIFGWCIEYRQPAIAIIISSCLISFSASFFVSCCTTSLVDMFPGRGNASTSCLNLVRCLLAALGAGVLDKMVRALNLGGCYTLVAGICLLGDLLLGYIYYHTNKESKLAKS